MKNYSSYKDTEEVYFSTEMSFLIVPVLIAAVITYVLLTFFGIEIAVLFNVFIAFCANLYFYSYGKSYVDVPFSLLISTGLTSCLLLFGDYGVYALVLYQNTGIFNALYFKIWLAVLLGSPVLYYAFQYGCYYLEVRANAVKYVKLQLKVHHDRELFIVLDAIQFVNSSKKTMSDIKLEKPQRFYSKDELSKLRQEDVLHHYLEMKVFNSGVHMPVGSDFLYISWYSIIEDKYYDIELPFPFEKLTIEQEKYPTDVPAVLRGRKTKPLYQHLQIHTNGRIRFFNDDLVLIDHPQSSPTPITEEERNNKIALHRSSHEYYNNPERFSELVNKIRSSGRIEERFLIKNKLILWSLTVSGLRGNNYLEIADVSFHNYKAAVSDTETSKLRFLPKKLVIVYRGNSLLPWLIIHINTQKLYQSIQYLTNGNDEIPVLFDLAFEDLSKINLKFNITTKENSVLFSDWEIQIDKYRNQSRIDHLLDIDEDQQKRSLYKEAWDLVASRKYDLAQEKCDMIKAIDPRYGFAYFLEVRLLWYKEGFEACYAKKDYFIAKTQHEPAALAHIYNNYGCLYDQELKYNESLSYFEKAILSNPKDGMYVCNLAEIYCKLNNPKKALEAAEKSKQLGHESSTLNSILESKGMRYI